MQPADEAPAQNAADTLTGESIPSSEPVQRRETAADTN
jgi:hypothetical protein